VRPACIVHVKHPFCFAEPLIRFVTVLSLLFAATTAALARAEAPAFDPRDWRGQHVGAPTQILTIGSAHLGQMANPPSDALLAPLLERLAAFRPEIITHEGRTGEQCDVLKRYPSRYPTMFDTYCWGIEDAEKATGLNVPDAMAAVEKALAAWPKAPSPAQRRQLAAWFLAAGDPLRLKCQGCAFPPLSASSAMGSTRRC